MAANAVTRALAASRAVRLPASFRSTHQTAGLPGFPATDVFGAPGTPVFAPVGGKMVYVHNIPWNAQQRVGGETAYLQGANDRTYFLTHLGGDVPTGNVTAGEQIGTVGAVPQNWWQPHIHEGVYQGIYNPPGASEQPYHPGQPSGVEQQPYNPASDSPLAARIDQFLQSKHSPLAGLGKTFVTAGAQNRVDPRLLVAISGGETGFATDPNAGADITTGHNAWGMGPHIQYGSWQQGINAAARNLGENYIAKGLTSIPAIQKKWAPLSAANDPTGLNQNWINTNSQFYRQLGGNPASVVYRAPAALAQVDAGPPPGTRPPLRPPAAAAPPQQNVAERIRSGIVTALLAHGGQMNPQTLLNVALNARRAR